MNRKLIPLLLGVTLAAASGFASAHSNVSFGLYVGAPAYSYAPAPVYYAPVPVYYPGPAYYRPSTMDRRCVTTALITAGGTGTIGIIAVDISQPAF